MEINKVMSCTTAYNPKKIFLISFSFLFLLMESYLYISKPIVFYTQTPFFIFSLIIALCFKRCKLLLRDWIVFICQLLLFNSIRGAIGALIKYFNLPVYSSYVIKFEQLFIPGSTLPHILQEKISSQPHFNLIEKFLAFIYAFHFIYFFLIGFLIWFKKPNEFWRFKFALISCAFIGLFCYLVLPTMPPWLASKKSLIPHVSNLFIDIMQAKFNNIIIQLDTNPVAAMPSLHVAFPFLCFLSLKYHFNLKSWPSFIYLLLVIFTTVLLGAHYIADLLGGILLASFCYWIFYIKKQDHQPYIKTASAIDVGIQICIGICYLLLAAIIASFTASLKV